MSKKLSREFTTPWITSDFSLYFGGCIGAKETATNHGPKSYLHL